MMSQFLNKTQAKKAGEARNALVAIAGTRYGMARVNLGYPKFALAMASVEGPFK